MQTLSLPHIEIPSARKMTLGQLIALARVSDYSEKKTEQRTDEDYEALDEALYWLLDISRSDVVKLETSTLESIRDSVNRILYDACLGYVQITNSANNPNLFECYPVSRAERELIQVEVKHKLKGALTRKRKANKKAVFEIQSDLSRLPTRIWVKFLDNLIKRYERIDGKKIWKYFYLIPEVLASVAWKKDESYYTKSIEGRTIVNTGRIKQHEEILLQMNGFDAIRAFGFFLTTAKPYLKSQYSKS